MLKINHSDSDNQREPREPIEQDTNDNSSSGSHTVHANCCAENYIGGAQLNTPIINRPCYFNHDDWFILQNRKMRPGLYFHGQTEKSGECTDVDDWICTPLVIDAITSSGSGRNFGRQLRFIDQYGSSHTWAMPMHLLNSNGDILLAELLDQGLTFDRRKRAHLINYVMTFKPSRKMIAVDTVGWHGKTFVLPNTVIGDDDIVFQSEQCNESEFKSAGTLKGWQNEIGRYCVDNPSLIFTVSAALTGPLLNLANRKQGAGIHWVGDSSSGKSTALEVAASVWGASEFIRSWSSTANGIESIATTRNDTVLLLDEIDEASPSEIGKISYMLSNGFGKQRAGKSGHARKIQRWSIIAISTGERSLWGIMNDIQKQPNPGQLVRLLNIDSKYEYGIFSNLHGFTTGHGFSDHLKAARLRNYGIVGPTFVSKLLEENVDVPDQLKKIEEVFSTHANFRIEKRAATVFALIGLAGELAIQYGILPWPGGASLNAALDAFKRWKNFNPAGQTEDDRILQSITDFTDKYGDSKFSSCSRSNIDDSISNRAGWYRDSAEDIVHGRTYMFTNTGLLEACGNKFELKRITSCLIQAGWITEYEPNRNTKKVSIAGTKKNLYHVRIKENDHES